MMSNQENSNQSYAFMHTEYDIQEVHFLNNPYPDLLSELEKVACITLDFNDKHIQPYVGYDMVLILNKKAFSKNLIYGYLRKLYNNPKIEKFLTTFSIGDTEILHKIKDKNFALISTRNLS